MCCKLHGNRETTGDLTGAGITMWRLRTKQQANLNEQAASTLNRELRIKSVLQLDNAHRAAHVIRFRLRRVDFFSFILLLSLALRLQGATMLQPKEIISGIDKAQQFRERKLAGYTAMESYTVRNSHFDQTAELTATVFYQKGAGKTYHVLSRNGPQFLQERVLHRILKEDATLSRNSERSQTLLTSANYSMNVQGTQLLHGKLCYIIGIHPKVHEFSLIEGTAWVDAEGFSLLRIEGKPAASPSFWTGRPFIEREYTLVDGLSFPQHSRATSKGFFAGRSELDINYSQYLVSLSP
jgi:hypothetical protein